MAALLLNRCNPIGRDAQQGITVSTLVTASEGARFLSNRQLQIALALDGNPDADGAAGTKFGRFVEAVRQHSSVDLVGVGDSTLRGPSKAFAIAAAWRRDRREWKEHYRKNPLTFRLRSLQTKRWIDGLDRSPGIILQVAALSRPSPPTGLPYALYLDFTFALTEREWPERAPMARIELPFWRRLEMQTYEGASAIFSRSHYVARSLRDDYGISPEKIHVVGAGVNIPLPDPATLPARDQPRALFIGSDFRRKGGDVLLAAWPVVLRRVPGAVLTIIGPTNGPLPRNVESNGGTWEPATILQELQRSSVFVMPSRCETWGDVFLEAMAYGLPCIGSSNDAMPEIIDDGQTGYIVPVDDPVALAGRLSCLLMDPERARTFGLAGRRKVETQYIWSHVLDQMLPVLSTV